MDNIILYRLTISCRLSIILHNFKSMDSILQQLFYLYFCQLGLHFYLNSKVGYFMKIMVLRLIQLPKQLLFLPKAILK